MKWQMAHEKPRCDLTSLWLGALLLAAASPRVCRAELPAAAHFRKNVQPILETYCSDCHADGMKRGGVAFDEFKSDESLLAKHDLWLAVLKNIRAGLMPPAKKPQPRAEERQRLEQWIKFDAFAIDPQNLDPGRVTTRRLNRVEYRNTIRDLMGIDFNSEVEFPPDDTGYGFDNIGDVLTVSPMLLEKYMAAAKTIVSEAVPTVSKVIPERIIAGSGFHGADKNRKETLLSLSYYEPAVVSNIFRADHAGRYRVTLELSVKGNFDYDPARCRVAFKVDNRELLQKEFGWYDNKTFHFDFDEKWQPGEHRMLFELEPLTPVEKKINSLEMRIVSATIRGPKEEEYWSRPKNYDRFFTRDAPKNPAERREYAGEVLRKFATKAFRRPVDDETVERLVAVAQGIYTQPGKTFEADQYVSNSCPYLYTWDGAQWRFACDFNWRSPLGMLFARGVPVPHDQTRDWVKVSGDLLKALEHPNIHVRKTAQRLITEQGSGMPSDQFLKTFSPTAANVDQSNVRWNIHWQWILANLNLQPRPERPVPVRENPELRKNSLRVLTAMVQGKPGGNLLRPML